MYEQFPQSPLEETSPIPDVYTAIATAREYAVSVDAAQTLNTGIPRGREQTTSEVNLGTIRNLTDKDIVELGDAPLYEPNVVSTNDPEDFILFLRTVYGLPLDAAGDPATELVVKETYEHELMHAVAARNLQPDIDVRFALSFFTKTLPNGDSQLFMMPSVVPVGKMRKIDMALMTAAPEDCSAGDLENLRNMGYESREEVFAKYWAVTPSELDAQQNSGPIVQ